MENVSPSFFRAQWNNVLQGDQAARRGSRIMVESSGGTARSLSSCTIGSPQQLWPPSGQLWDAGNTATGFRTCMMTEGEHPVSAKCWGLWNQFVRWWVPGFTLAILYSHPSLKKMCFFWVQIAFQPRFSRVSAMALHRIFSPLSEHGFRRVVGARLCTAFNK